MTSQRTRILPLRGDATVILAPPPALYGRILILHGPRAGLEVAVVALPFALGRSPDNDLSIADPTVSAYHARIVAGEDGVYIEDAGSRNHTYVAHDPVQRQRLHGGEELRLGGVTLRYLRAGQVYDLGCGPDPERETVTGVRCLRRHQWWRGRPVVAATVLIALLLLSAWPAVRDGRIPAPVASPPATAAAGSAIGALQAPGVVSVLPQTAAQLQAPVAAAPQPPRVTSRPAPTGRPLSAVNTPPMGAPGQKPASAAARNHAVARMAAERADFIAALRDCDACDATVRTALLDLAQPPHDFPAALRAARALIVLADAGWLSAPQAAAQVRHLRDRVDPWAGDLIAQGMAADVKRLLDRLAQALGPYRQVLATAPSSRSLEQLARPDVERAHALAAVNPVAAREHYRRARALLPEFMPLAAQVAAADEALP